MQEFSRSAVNNLKFNKSSVLDNNPQWLLEDKWINSAAIVAKLLTKIINAFFVVEVVPGEEEYTKVTPVFVWLTRSVNHAMPWPKIFIPVFVTVNSVVVTWFTIMDFTIINRNIHDY